MSIERKLTAIMFTDIVGYSEMVNSNQNHAMELLAMHDKIIEPIINNNDGKIIKKIGDAIFAELPNSFNSVVCAQNIQTELNKRNEMSNPKDKIVIRIGLHTGTFIRKDNDLFGHDVNLCSRIESMAPEGGIAASCNLIDSLKNNNIPYREMGFVKLKNISNPHKLYKIYNNFDEYDSESPSQLQSDLKGIGIDIIDMDSYSIIDTVSIAVLYINNLRSESKESISYSLTNELIDDLAYIEKFRVCSFNDISQFIKSGMEKSDIGRQLKVDNILSGNIYIKDGKIKLNFFHCRNCGEVINHSYFQPLLYVNKDQSFAIWFAPRFEDDTRFQAMIDALETPISHQIETKIRNDVEGYKRSFIPADNYYVTAPIIRTWEEFKKTIIKFESGELKGKPIDGLGEPLEDIY